MNKAPIKLLLAALATALGSAASLSQTASQPKSDLEYWLSQSRPATSQTAATSVGIDPFGPADRFSRPDAAPGVVVLSDGQVLAGSIFTTRDRSWEVWLEAEKRWRHIPPLAVLSIQAVVVEEALEKEWRWKQMGSDEKLYAGRQKPVRRLLWRFHLIDDSYLTGAVKGQPLWIDCGGKRLGPFILHERSAGQYGQQLKDLPYVKKVVISRRAMQEVIKLGPASSNHAS